MMPVDLVVERLRDHGGNPRRSGDAWSARCPAHDDRAPSLSISEGRDGCAVICCHAGCDTEAVVGALELTMLDLFPPKDATAAPARIVARYAYVDELGTVLSEKVRYSPKRFVQRKPDGRGGWEYRLNGVRRVPYRLPEVLAGVAADRWVLVAEGEKAADRLVEAGFVATCGAGGAGKFALTEHDAFRGAKVAILPDNDKPGRAHACDVAARLAGIAAEVRLVELPDLPPKGDACDWLEAGHGAEELKLLIRSAPAWSPDLAVLTDTEVVDAPNNAAGNLPPEFWSSRPSLAHIRQAAHARSRSADAVLGAVLARMSAFVPPSLRLPPIVGAESPVSMFVALVAPSGAGKSSAVEIARELLPVPPERAMHIAPELPIGSGEGLVESLFGWVEESTSGGGVKERKVRVYDGAVVYVDEGAALADLGARKGSTLLAVLRSAWSGAQVGNANATRDRTRILPAHSYAFGVVVGIQDAKAGPLLDDRDAGTPQRFLYARATDPHVPDEQPQWPGPLAWRLPTPAHLEEHIAGADEHGRPIHHLDVDPVIADEIRAADLAQVRGEHQADELDSHARLIRLRVAALLALLDGRVDVTVDDWQLADQMKQTADTVRTHILDTIRDADARQETATSHRLARRRVVAEEAVEHARLRQTIAAAQRLAGLVHDRGPTNVPDLRRRLTANQRVHLEDAIVHGTAEGWVVEREEPGQGTPARVLHPGDRKPPR